MRLRLLGDDPFAETKEPIAGFTVINVKFPNPRGEELDMGIEVRRFFELERGGWKRTG
ncbi:MAG TPA: hypothetical protein VFX30_03415 [bacterium]|nr:hypothetical protein [bacterium]